MKRWVLLAAAALSASVSANAAVVTLEGVTQNGANDYTFSYEGTLGPDEGLQNGDRLIIYDFAGYIAGSVSSPFANVMASVENVSTGLITPGFTDRPDLVNLVFTYTGGDFRDEGGPFQPIDFSGLTARSTLGGTRLSAFFSNTTKNNPDRRPGGSGTDVFTLGSVGTPAIPEPATWAMMIGGFGMLGAATRRRGKTTTVSA
jgi:hypothetical protein